MPIIHRKQSPQVRRLQEGGTIPVYGTFQVQHAQFAPNNPISLLEKYKGVPLASATPVSTEVKESKLPDMDGLDNDATAISINIDRLGKQLEAGMSSDPNFANTPMGKSVRSKLELETSRQVVLAKNRKDKYKNNYEQMQTKMSEGAPVYQNGKFMAAYVEQDGQGNYQYNYKMIPAEQLHEKDAEGNNLWAPITYGQLADKLNSDMNPMFLNNSTNTDLLGYGMGMNYVTEKVLDKNYTEIGETVNEWSKEKGGDVNEMGDILEKFLQSESNTTNEPQLMAALSKIKHYMGEPAMDAMRGHFWLNSTNAAQVEDKVNKYLAAHMAQRLGIKVSTEDATIWTTPEELAIRKGGGSGGESSALGSLSEYVIEASETLAPFYISHEATKVFKNLGTTKPSNNVMTLVAWNAPATTKLLDPTTIMSRQNHAAAGKAGSFGMAGDINNAESAEGKALNSITYEAGSLGNAKFMDMAMPSAGQTVRVTRVPMQNGKLFRAGVTAMTEMNNQIDAIEKQRAADKTAQPGTAAYEDYERRIKAIEDKFTSKYQGVVLEPRYLVDVIYYDPDDNMKSEHKVNHLQSSSISEEDMKNYKKMFAESIDGASSWQWNDEVDKDNLKKTTIMVPTNDLVQLQKLGGQVYAQKNSLTMSALEKDETYRRYIGMSQEDIVSALRSKANQGGGYQTMYYRQLLNK